MKNSFYLIEKDTCEKMQKEKDLILNKWLINNIFNNPEVNNVTLSKQLDGDRYQIIDINKKVIAELNFKQRININE